MTPSLAGTTFRTLEKDTRAVTHFYKASSSQLDQPSAKVRVRAGSIVGE